MTPQSICAGCQPGGACEACAEDYRLAQQRAQAGVCDGACQEHVGPTRLVRVSSLYGGNDWGYWAYCEAAMQADRANGLRVTPEGCRHLNMESKFFQDGPPDGPVDMVYWCPDCWKYFDDPEGQEPAAELPPRTPDDSDVPF